MIDAKLQNIEELKKQKLKVFLSSNSLIDIILKQVVLLTISDEWFLTSFFDEILSTVSDSSSNS